jgi:hypothetical protein
VVRHLHQQRATGGMHNKTGITIVYLKYNNSQQTLENLIAGLIKQLIQDIDTIPEPLQNLYEQHNAGETPASWKEILALFKSQEKTYDKVYLLVNGLDETTEEYSLVFDLKPLGSGS